MIETSKIIQLIKNSSPDTIKVGLELLYAHGEATHLLNLAKKGLKIEYRGIVIFGIDPKKQKMAVYVCKEPNFQLNMNIPPKASLRFASKRHFKKCMVVRNYMHVHKMTEIQKYRWIEDIFIKLISATEQIDKIKEYVSTT